MSDTESNYSNSESDNDSEIETKTRIKSKIVTDGKTIDDYISDSESEEEGGVVDIEEDQNGEPGGVGGVDWRSDDSENEDNESDIEDEDDNEPEEKLDTKKKVSKPKTPVQIEINDDDDEDDEDDESYLQKFDNDITKNYINEFHPECLIHNYDEISKLTNVIRDSNNIIVDPLHKTIPFLTKYERARILGQRAKQIETGSRPFVKVPENIIDSYVIAELELKQKKIPFIIRRPIPGGACEYWNLKDLEVILF